MRDKRHFVGAEGRAHAEIAVKGEPAACSVAVSGKSMLRTDFGAKKTEGESSFRLNGQSDQ